MVIDFPLSYTFNFDRVDQYIGPLIVRLLSLNLPLSNANCPHLRSYLQPVTPLSLLRSSPFTLQYSINFSPLPRQTPSILYNYLVLRIPHLRKPHYVSPTYVSPLRIPNLRIPNLGIPTYVSLNFRFPSHARLLTRQAITFTQMFHIATLL